MNEYKLIYHDKESSTGGISPFDKAITEIMKNGDVSIVCPYIRIGYFDRITKLANSWRLVTDVEEWISFNNMEARQNIKNFILNNLSTIHHYKDIHAKVVVSDDNAFIGSSNFTNKGIKERVEMAVLIEEKEQVVELQKWFCDLWDESEVVNIQDLEWYMASIRSSSSHDMNAPKTLLPSKAAPIKARLLDIGSNIQDTIKSDQDSYKRLIECIKKLTLDRKWMNDYFDLAKEMIDFTGLTSDDPRLVMSIPKSSEIPITINQRYVLNPKYNGRIGLIMPLNYGGSEYDKDGVVQIHDGYFFRNKIREARWIEFERKNGIEFSERIKDYWKQAVLTELKKGNKSGFKKFHEPIVYEVIVNLSYRNGLLDKVFS